MAVSGINDTKMIMALYSDNEAVVKISDLKIRLPIGLQPRNQNPIVVEKSSEFVLLHSRSTLKCPELCDLAIGRALEFCGHSANIPAPHPQWPAYPFFSAGSATSFDATQCLDGD